MITLVHHSTPRNTLEQGHDSISNSRKHQNTVPKQGDRVMHHNQNDYSLQEFDYLENVGTLIPLLAVLDSHFKEDTKLTW